MSNNYAAIAKQLKVLRGYIVDFYGIDVRDFTIKIIAESNLAYTELLPEKGSIINISSNNLRINHILAHEITHTQIPIANPFFAEGFASLISCKIAGDCSPFWFPEKNVVEVIQNYSQYYVGLKRFVNNRDLFDDFAKIASRYAHIVAAGFIEWLVEKFRGVTKALINNIETEPEIVLSEIYDCNLVILEHEWLKSIGVVYDARLCSY